MAEQRLVLAGGSGYLGRHLARWFAERDWTVTVLARRPGGVPGAASVLVWDGMTVGSWAVAINGADAVVNLAGRTVNCRYTAANRREIYASRLDSTRALGQAIAAAAAPPPVWVNAASATIYRHAEDRPMDEPTGELGSDFSCDVCKQWEAELSAAPTPRTRRVAMRAAMVMGPGRGGVYEAFRGIARRGLGGTLGPGTQFVSWVHVDDFCRAVEFLIDPPPPAGGPATRTGSALEGPVNVASPNPIPNREFMRLLRRAVGVRVGLPAARWMLEVGAVFLRTETELLLKSRRVVPTRLLDAGFTFTFPEWGGAAKDIESRWDAPAARAGRGRRTGSRDASRRRSGMISAMGAVLTSPAAAQPDRPVPEPAAEIPPLENGDRLTRDEFERRYHAMPHVKKAELIEGVVHMPSPVRLRKHGQPHTRLVTWLGIYEAVTPGVIAGDNSTARLDLDNDPQPDVLLMIDPDKGGQARISPDDYVEGAPELVGEVASSSANVDLHAKLNAYRRNGVREYVVWVVGEREVRWFVLAEGRYDRLPPAADGLLRSRAFPGLWLDPAALVGGDMARALDAARQGTASPEHAEFVRMLGQR